MGERDSRHAYRLSRRCLVAINATRNEFLQSEGAVFRNIEPNLTANGTSPESHAGHRIVQGVDWAQKEDFTAISTFCATCKVELELDRFNKIQWDFQRGRLRTSYDRWKV